MIRAASFAVLLAGPAFAQDADPAAQAIEAYVACFATHGATEMITPSLEQFGWTFAEGEEGITDAAPAKGEDTYAHFSGDGTACWVDSQKLGTEAALAALTAALKGAGTDLPAPGTDANGCALYDLGAGTTIALTSGGNDPVCTSDTDSTVRFDFAPK